MLPDLRGANVTVMGLGRFGGGLGVTRWLAAQGARVLVTDLLSAEALIDSIRALQPLLDDGSVRLDLGRHQESAFTTPDMVIANPAVPRPWADPFLGAASAAGIPVTTEMGLLVRQLPRERVIGVTGTAGKSTTAAMIHHLLQERGRRRGFTSHLGGNIGGSLLSEIDHIGAEDWIVLELSSAMLHWLAIDGANGSVFSPRIAVVTNISPHHLDWHGTFENYVKAKENICRGQTSVQDHLIYARREDEACPMEHWDTGRGRAWPLNEAHTAADPWPIEPHLRLALPGAHNRVNARLAVVAATLAGPGDAATAADAAASLANFRGLPHRLELVHEQDGIRFVNDSKSTTALGARLAVECFEDPRRVHLIAGGYDRGLDLGSITSLAPELAGLYTIGTTGPHLADAALPPARVERCETLARAVEQAIPRLGAGDVLLLSPGCASWDQFPNYEERGRVFRELIRAATKRRGDDATEGTGEETVAPC